MLAAFLCLMIASTVVNSAMSEESLTVTPELPSGSRKGSTETSDVTIQEEGYLNTTNPYSSLTSDPIDEIDEEEGPNPVFILVFADEEEASSSIRDRLMSWDLWATTQIERGDEALVSKFGIDMRILSFLDWDSDDSKTSLLDLANELEQEKGSYLGQWYKGKYWQNYVDVIIGITAQDTTGGAGLSWGDFVLLKWQAYWADDNLFMHLISQNFGANPHKEEPGCVMATHTHYRTWIYEDGSYYGVFRDVPCFYTSYDWCTSHCCYDTISANRRKYCLSSGNAKGGEVVPIDVLGLLAPYITLVSVVSIGFGIFSQKFGKRRERN